jgi:hypothetical protein
MQSIFTTLAIIGTALPLSRLIPWLGEHGMDLRLFVEQLFVNPISSFFGLDVVVSAIVTVVLILGEGRRVEVPRLWLPIAGTFLVGVSLGLPLFLAMRERALESSGTA